MSNRPYTDFDLPSKHLTGEKHFIPPKARDRAEVDRRKAQPAGTLLAEYQHAGLAISTIILGILDDTPDIDSAARIIVPAGLNSSWYSHARHAAVMRRRLKLAQLATSDPEQRPSSYMLHHEATDLFGAATNFGQLLVTATRRRLDTAPDLQKQLSRTLGHASLVLDSVVIGDQIGYGDIQVTDFELQAMARNRALHALEQARTLQQATGEPPSIAGLADYDSGISVYLRRNATDNVVEAYEQAYEVAAIAA